MSLTVGVQVRPRDRAELDGRPLPAEQRHVAEGLGGLDDRPKPGRPRTVDELAIVQATLGPPPDSLG
jgi:hypothetical protein